MNNQSRDFPEIRLYIFQIKSIRILKTIPIKIATPIDIGAFLVTKEAKKPIIAPTTRPSIARENSLSMLEL